MQEQPSKFPNPIEMFTHSITLKMIGIGCLVGLLLLPSSMIQSLIKERKERSSQVIGEISTKWAHDQTIAGPILAIPYQSPENIVKYLHVLPDELAMSGTLLPEIRYRGIYKAVLYTTELQIQGYFTVPDIEAFHLTSDSVFWSEAILALGISDLRGITKKVETMFNNQALTMKAGIRSPQVLSSGVSTPVDVPVTRRSLPFNIKVKLNGNRTINFVPVGSITSVSLSSNWDSPSFGGTALPVERTVNQEGFSAAWHVLEVNRNYPQIWFDTEYALTPSAFGVSLVIPVDIYQMSTRAVKYSFLFVLLTFAVFFVSELLNNTRIHPIQYLLIGLAILVFYTLLLSLSEHVNFPIAYLIAGIGVTGVITAYAQAIVDRWPFTLTVLGLLASLYGYLYVLLQLEDYALLSGSIGAFVILSVIMFVTRRIDWYRIRFGDGASEHF